MGLVMQEGLEFGCAFEVEILVGRSRPHAEVTDCLLYTSDAADDSLRVDLCGRRIIKKKKTHHKT